MKIKGYTVGGRHYVSVDDLLIILYEFKEDYEESLRDREDAFSAKYALLIIKKLIENMKEFKDKESEG